MNRPASILCPPRGRGLVVRGFAAARWRWSFTRIVAAAVLCLAFASFALPAPPLYWQASIAHALDTRDACLQRIGVDRYSVRWIAATNADIAEAAELAFETASEGETPWYHLLMGAGYLQSSPDAAREHFERALSAATGNPGVLWVVFMELRGLGQDDLAQECLERLEEIALASGATSVDVVVHQLLAVARNESDRAAADGYYEWMRRFTTADFWPLLLRAWHALPRRPLAALGTFTESLYSLRGSWSSQLELAYYAHRWLRAAAAAFIVACLLSFATKALPSALHPVTELYPVVLPPWLRHTLAVVGYLSLVSLGLYPFLVLTAVLLWRHLNKRDQAILAACVVMLVAAPLDTRLSDMLSNALRPAQSVSLYRQSMREGYHAELDARISSFMKRHPDDHLAAVAAALSRYKANDLEGAARHIHAAEYLRGDDPVVLVTSGIVQFSLGNHDRAVERFQRCVDLFPRYESAYYNLGQCHVAMRQALMGTDMIKQARDIALSTGTRPNPVDVFLARNDRHFGESIPRLRRMMLPDYRPADFWLRVFPARTGSWRTAAQRWAPHLFGLGPLASAAVVLALSALSMGAARRSVSHKAAKSLFHCSLCGMPMCRKCKAGRVCISCHGATEHDSNIAVRRKIEERITERRAAIERWVAGGVNVLFPGAGLLLGKRAPAWKALLLMAATAAIYAVYLFLITFVPPFPSGLIRTAWWVLFGATAVTHLYLVARAVVRTMNERRPKGVLLWR